MIELTAQLVVRGWRLRPSIIHCHDTMVLPAGAILKLLLKSNLVYDAHELESDKAGQTPVLSKATLAIERRCWPLVDAFITVSPSIATWYEENLGRKPTLCLLNSPATSPTAPNGTGSKPDVKSDLGLAADQPLFVYVGALEPGRGIDLILRAFASLTVDAHVAFVGGGSLVESVKAVSAVETNVHYHTPVPHDTLVQFIRTADGAFCLVEDHSLSDYYCLPNKLFEYAFAGLRVIASRLPDIEAMVDQYDLGVCIDRNEESVRSAVRALLDPPARATSRDLTSLRWDTQAGNLLSFYSELAPADPTPVS